MTQTILIILGVLIVLLLVFRRTREPIVGICAAAIGLDAKKRERKEKNFGIVGICAAFLYMLLLAI